MTITLTPAQLTLAQMGREINLNTGETLCAEPRGRGEWRYTLRREGVLVLDRYAGPGVPRALHALDPRNPAKAWCYTWSGH